MLNFPALDVAIGLIFVFFILALVCSGINEAIARSAALARAGPRARLVGAAPGSGAGFGGARAS